MKSSLEMVTEIKQLELPFTRKFNKYNIIADVSRHLDTFSRYSLNYTPWDDFLYKPEVCFSISHSRDSIFLKFYVDEEFIRAGNTRINSNVFEDSCVEFFIGFDGEEEYYNLEFNCIGTGRIGFGKERVKRTLLDENIIEKISYQSLITNNKTRNTVHWELTLNIPVEVFIYHNLQSLSGKLCRANFYKCGDLLPVPHFVSWSNIHSPEPNFHLPEFFGNLKFL